MGFKFPIKLPHLSISALRKEETFETEISFNRGLSQRVSLLFDVKEIIRCKPLARCLVETEYAD